MSEDMWTFMVGRRAFGEYHCSAGEISVALHRWQGTRADRWEPYQASETGACSLKCGQICHLKRRDSFSILWYHFSSRDCRQPPPHLCGPDRDDSSISGSGKLAFTASNVGRF
jgi:hypothetical protein